MKKDFGFGFKTCPLKRVRNIPYQEKIKLYDKLFIPLLIVVFLLIISPFATIFFMVFMSHIKG